MGVMGVMGVMGRESPGIENRALGSTGSCFGRWVGISALSLAAQATWRLLPGLDYLRKEGSEARAPNPSTPPVGGVRASRSSAANRGPQYAPPRWAC